MHLPKPSESGSFELTPAGTHVGICYRFIDLGTQMNDYKGERKTRHEIMLSWELPDELMADGRPFTCSKTYTWSMNDKATLRQHLESWRGKAFVDEDFEGPQAFNTRKLIGVPCMIAITHVAGERDGKVMDRIASIGKLTKGINVPPLTNAKVYLALEPEGWSQEIYETLSDKVKTKIIGSPEYRDLMAKKSRPDDPGQGNGTYDDEIPF